MKDHMRPHIGLGRPKHWSPFFRVSNFPSPFKAHPLQNCGLLLREQKDADSKRNNKNLNSSLKKCCYKVYIYISSLTNLISYFK